MREVDTIKTVLNEKLTGIVSEEFVTSDFEDLIAYSRDQMSPILGSYTPDFVVMPKYVEEVQKILKIANEFEVAVYPYAFGTNTTGTALAFNHGIVLDLRRLNQIIEINDD